MSKVSRALVTLVLTGLLLALMTGPASAAGDTDILACWNNCGIGGGGTKLD